MALDFTIFYQIFLSLQVKWVMIISKWNGIDELSHNMLKELRLTIFRIW